MKTFLNYSNKILFFLFIILKTISPKTVSTSIRCLQVNQYDGLLNGEKIIGDKQKCFDVSPNCCFINLTFKYGDYLLKHEYCNYLNVNITEFQQFLYDMYNDDEMFYANFTAHNYDMYETIGRNLDKKLTDELNCFIGPKNYEEYSTYDVYNCKEFVDGICTGKKNTTQFNAFMSGFHKNYSNAYCNKKEEGQKCIKYNGTRANDKMVKPLLDELSAYLQADNDTYVVFYNNTNVDIDPEIDEEDGSSTFLDHWSKDEKFVKSCKPRPNISVTVECPEGYVFQEYMISNKILLFILILILF